uniref:Cyclic nucleotide-binding domain-containing protein n=1 Tax=Zooxanthella nutricula TaxID=1333877 RepID=A0A7S2P568_9DINO
MVVISGISWAVVLGQVCGTIANLNKDEQAFRSIMDELNVMMTDRVMPLEMRRRLRSFFLSNKSAQRRARHMRILNSMSPGLKGEVVMELNRVWIQKVSILNSILLDARASDGLYLHAFVVDVSMGLQTAFHAQSETFGSIQALYILGRGVVCRSCRLHSAGAVWGVDFLLSTRELLEPFECLALTYVEVMSLPRGKFFELVEEHKDRCPGLARKVRWFCCWLGAQRAILQEARRRRKHNVRDTRHRAIREDADSDSSCGRMGRLREQHKFSI